MVSYFSIMPNNANNIGQNDRARVMVVDDSPGVLRSLVLLLHHFGFEVWGFLDQHEAVAAIPKCEPDVLICDAHVNEANEIEDPCPECIEGIKVASEIQHVRPECDVIIMSANLRPATILDRAEKLGVRARVLPKPSNPANLISELRSRKTG